MKRHRFRAILAQVGDLLLPRCHYNRIADDSFAYFSLLLWQLKIF